MDLKENKNRPILATVYAIIFLILLLLVKLNSPIVHGIDHIVQSIVFSFTNEHLTVLISILTNFGSPIVSLILACLVLAFVFFKREYAAAIWGFGTLLGHVQRLPNGLLLRTVIVSQAATFLERRYSFFFYLR